MLALTDIFKNIVHSEIEQKASDSSSVCTKVTGKENFTKMTLLER